MKAIILAAGRGSRLKGLTEDRPKCLVELRGRTLLDRQAAALKIAGIAQTGIVRGYLSEMLNMPGFTFFDNPRWELTNMVRSLERAAGWLETEPCVVSYADIIYSGDAVSRLMAAEGEIVITYDRNWLELWRARFPDPLSDAETFRTDASGILTEIGRKTGSLDDIQGQYMGLLKFTPAGWRRVSALLAALPPEKADLLDMTGLLGRLIEAGVRIRAVPITDKWYEVDSEADLRLYESMGVE